MKQVEQTKKVINQRYDLKTEQANELIASGDIFDIIYNTFIFGYAQGMKASKVRGTSYE